MIVVGLIWNVHCIGKVVLKNKFNASAVHAYITWNLQKEVRTDSMNSRTMKSFTNEHTARSRPTLKDIKRFRTLKDIKRFRNGSVCKPYERSIYERTF